MWDINVVSELRAKVSRYPLCSIALTAVLGLIFGAAATTQNAAPRANIPGLKEGFMLVAPTSRLQDPASQLKLKGSKVVIVHRDDEASPPCKADHAPLQFFANEKLSILSGSFNDMEQLLETVSSADLKRLQFTEPADLSLPRCETKAKITYGEEAYL